MVFHLKILIESGANFRTKHTSDNVDALDYTLLLEEYEIVRYLENYIKNIKNLYSLYNEFHKVEWNNHKKVLIDYAKSINDTEFINTFKY